MPGATDELYFFRRVHARLTNDAPTLLDAVCALTNQSFIQATFRPPLLLLHTVEDPLEPEIVVEDERTADRIRKKHFEKRAVFYDRDWDFVEPILAFDLDTRLSPGLRSHDSHHFFRHSLVECDLNGWDALEAIALAGKTKVIIEHKLIEFKGDTRYREVPPNLGDFIPLKIWEIDLMYLARHAATKGILQKETKETKRGKNFAKNAEFSGIAMPRRNAAQEKTEI